MTNDSGDPGQRPSHASFLFLSYFLFGLNESEKLSQLERVFALSSLNAKWERDNGKKQLNTAATTTNNIKAYLFDLPYPAQQLTMNNNK